MQQTRILMGMPVTVRVVDHWATYATLDGVFEYFEYVDATFSTYKKESEISRLNRHELMLEQASEDVKLVFALAEATRLETNGYFNIERNGVVDPSGLVKGWAIYNAALYLQQQGFRNFFVDAGGDIQAMGKNASGQDWRVGIRNPFNISEIVKVLCVTDCGVATSGTSARGQHVYNPHALDSAITEIVSLTVVGPNIYEADRFATAAFAMGRAGIGFIAELEGFAGYMIDADGIATYTPGFARLVHND